MMKRVGIITLAYEGREYTVTDEWDYDWPQAEIDAGLRFQWEENNNACDCNRSFSIGWQCDPDFPEMECGDTIQLIAIRIVDPDDVPCHEVAQ